MSNGTNGRTTNKLEEIRTFFNLGGLVEIGREISQIVRTRFGFIFETPRLTES